MSPDLHSILRAMKDRSTEAAALVTKAYHFATETHEGQKRLSGEPYLLHEVATARTLAELGMDAEAIAAGLLHDVIDDGGVEAKKVATQFGENTLFMVESVSRLSRLKYRGDEAERHAETLRKLFVAMAKDIRVLIVKLACRLHNVQTLEYIPVEKQRRQALETLDIYARLADRLGMGKLKEELEDGAFPYADPDDYERVREILKTQRKESDERLEKLYRSLATELGKQGIRAKVDYRVKGLYSTYKKLVEKEWHLEDINDLAALRVVVDSIESCYRTLGVIHGSWTPFPNRLRDYIATPKSNGYQSLHTVIFTGDGGRAEIQIRTEKMHQDAEYGIVSHVAYTEAGKPKDGARMVGRNLQWVKQLLEWQKQLATSSSGEFLQGLKTDFFQYQIFVFTPKGDVLELPQGATPIDFAYAIHSDIGDHVTGVHINTKFAALDTELKNGDVVEVITKKNARPSEKWLEHVKTSLARRHIRSVLSQRIK
ncbi:MAG: hypothetical protein A2542_00265 [Parcubacteria group bacterium RIFOXYD2_FULL_52_8]|nr:MAG: hypothetical protein A2542_00265 [Parcubacteria group bacterium RIFOXYD2_FULL_52_8]